MGFYLNPSARNFENDVASDIYIDKTLLLKELNHCLDKNSEKYLCISRPRRFGKTQAGNMIAAYYSLKANSRKLFDSLAISKGKTEKERKSYLANLNKYNVIKIDLNGFYRTVENLENIINELKKVIIEEFKAEYKSIDYTNCSSINQCILKTYANNGSTFVIIIDEYDVLIREKVDHKILDQYINLLNALFKDSTISEAISLAYLTGILPILRDKVESKLNNFTPSTMMEPFNLEKFFGFTTEEVKQICIDHDIDFDECKRWYDGYHLNQTDIYNPSAIVKTASLKKFASHWSTTGTYESIAEYIKLNFDGTKDNVIKMLGGEKIDVEVLSFQNKLTEINNRHDVFTYLIHIGYLAYDSENRSCYIPNYEVSLEWENAIRNQKDYSVTNKIIEDSKNLIEQVFELNSGAVAKSLDTSHIHVTSNRSYNNEAALGSAIYLSFIYALNEYICIKEATTGKGFADVIYVPVNSRKPAMIIELKRNQTCGIALAQIKSKEYFACLKDYSGEILFIGINYDDETKKHSASIEKFVKER